jgi:hypothetical protein
MSQRYACPGRGSSVRGSDVVRPSNTEPREAAVGLAAHRAGVAHLGLAAEVEAQHLPGGAASEPK